MKSSASEPGLMYQRALCLVMLASMYQYCLARVLAGFIHIWMEVLSALLYAKVKKRQLLITLLLN